MPGVPVGWRWRNPDHQAHDCGLVAARLFAGDALEGAHVIDGTVTVGEDDQAERVGCKRPDEFSDRYAEGAFLEIQALDGKAGKVHADHAGVVIETQGAQLLGVVAR